MMQKRILLADDHPVARLGVRHLLEEDPGFVIVGEARDGEETLRLVEERSPEILILDVEMPGMGGVEVARRLCESKSPVRILVFSEHDDPYLVKEMLAHGAYGYLTKEESPETLLSAIRGIAQGERGWVSRHIIAEMPFYQPDEREKVQELTEREIQVLQAVVKGQTNLEIGLALDISQKTVEKHLNRIFNKLSVGSRVEAAVQTVRGGWLWTNEESARQLEL